MSMAHKQKTDSAVKKFNEKSPAQIGGAFFEGL
jgi:hypothetical protein